MNIIFKAKHPINVSSWSAAPVFYCAWLAPTQQGISDSTIEQTNNT